MFQYEVNDANTASVVSGALGIPIASITAGQKNVSGRTVTVNQSQLGVVPLKRRHHKIKYNKIMLLM